MDAKRGYDNRRLILLSWYGTYKGRPMKMKQMVLMMSAAVLASFSQGAEPEKVAQVMAGELKEARVSWWGFNPEDSTEFLEAAIKSKVPKLIVDKQPSPWIAGKTLLLVSNQEIVFEEGVELLAKKGCFKRSSLKKL